MILPGLILILIGFLLLFFAYAQNAKAAIGGVFLILFGAIFQVINFFMWIFSQIP